jgi:hypothetical protein
MPERCQPGGITSGPSSNVQDQAGLARQKIPDPVIDPFRSQRLVATDRFIGVDVVPPDRIVDRRNGFVFGLSFLFLQQRTP